MIIIPSSLGALFAEWWCNLHAYTFLYTCITHNWTGHSEIGLCTYTVIFNIQICDVDLHNLVLAAKCVNWLSGHFDFSYVLMYSQGAILLH